LSVDPACVHATCQVRKAQGEATRRPPIFPLIVLAIALRQEAGARGIDPGRDRFATRCAAGQRPRRNLCPCLTDDPVENRASWSRGRVVETGSPMNWRSGA